MCTRVCVGVGVLGGGGGEGDEAILAGGKGAAAYIFMLIYNCLTSFSEDYLPEIGNKSYEL